MINIRNFFWVLFVVILFALPGCNNDEEPIDREILIVGIWESSEIRMNLLIGQVSLYQYYIDEMGFTENESEEAIQMIGDNFASGLVGYMEFNSDYTFASFFASSVETGTWWILNDTTLKLTESSMADQIDLTIISLNEVEFILGFDDSISEDLNEDGLVEEILIEIELVLNKAD